MGKIIIEFRGDPSDAIHQVLHIVNRGKVSSCRVRGQGVAHYCWATTWGDGSAVLTRRKNLPNGPDSFIVIAPGEPEEGGDSK